MKFWVSEFVTTDNLWSYEDYSGKLWFVVLGYEWSLAIITVILWVKNSLRMINFTLQTISYLRDDNSYLRDNDSYSTVTLDIIIVTFSDNNR